ncbi:MAG TPA: elongation factor G, partial [Clostridiales bacterium]|nr:elongation factor G [Clostridiales bacterium]
PADDTGDLMGEITKRRGRVLGMNPDQDGLQTVQAQVPMAEMQDFTAFMRQLTQGRGWFTFAFAQYEPLPGNLTEQVIAQAKTMGLHPEDE